MRTKRSPWLPDSTLVPTSIFSKSISMSGTGVRLPSFGAGSLLAVVALRFSSDDPKVDMM